ncbi:SH3 domain-containing protein [Caldimonas sp. KR1-144]|uniref:SH3 domain-containing protein n=1 Tax=Caldimonas sp. KR1-144 TaxID=3400911 RepID=UPI003C0A0269
MSRATPSLLAALLPAFIAVALFAGAPAARAADDAPAVERLTVADPYLEMRTGPGRGYPVFHVAARGEAVVVLLRFTDWFKVRTDNGKEGWVQRAQLEATLTEAGAAKSFRDMLLDDYLHRRLELGGAWGRFKSEPMLKIFTAYRLSETLSLEATLGQVQGTYSGTDFWHVNLNVEPWSDQRWSPFAGIGFGRMKNVPNLSLVDATTTNANTGNATVGLRYYLTDRFVLRADWTLHTAFIGDNRSSEFRAVTAGLSFFF